MNKSSKSNLVVVKGITLRVLIGAATLLLLEALPCSVSARVREDDGIAIVYRIYKDFSWQAVLEYSDSLESILGKPLPKQPRSVLNKYFDDTLSSLLINDAECVVRRGEICALDFDPIFASQDSAAYDLVITKTGINTIRVQFNYPSSSKGVTLEYIIIKTDKGWRISDIVYREFGDLTLKGILHRASH